MVKASELYKRGDATTIIYDWQPDGSVHVIVVTSNGRHGSFKARNLNEDGEEIWDDGQV